MIKRTLLAGAAALLIATPAYAHHCPKDVAAIDEALETLDVSDDVKAKVTELRDKGLAAHEAGNHHPESEHMLAEAMRMLLMNAK